MLHFPRLNFHLNLPRVIVVLSDVSALVKPRADRRTIASNLNFIGKMSLLLFTRAFYWGYFSNVIPRDIGHVCLH